ncbi:MAG: hypothetical protein WC869_17065 [Phycisphaerae bacterium]|jgi:hypothetical protein
MGPSPTSSGVLERFFSPGKPVKKKHKKITGISKLNKAFRRKK